MKIKNTPCITCKSFSLDKYGNFSCSKRGMNHTPGYGSFDVGATCIYDISMLTDKYEPMDDNMDEMIKLKKENAKISDVNYYLRKDIDQLKNTIEILAKKI